MNLWRWWMTCLATIPAQISEANRHLDPSRDGEWRAWIVPRHPRRSLRKIELRQVTQSAWMISALLLAGCIQTPPRPEPPGPDRQDVAPDSVYPVSEVAAALARRIDAKSFRHSDELLQTVQRLADAGELSKADADRLIDACEGIRAKRRDLTGEDAAALRGVK